MKDLIWKKSTSAIIVVLIVVSSFLFDNKCVNLLDEPNLPEELR